MKCSLNSPPKWMVCIDLLLNRVELNEGVCPRLYVNRIFHEVTSREAALA
ncbi:hypothetical protein XFF7767_380002 [Xanthomonas citri pv. fuscans]|nr:hypothetical protein XFF6990_10188 [Xanthomonas citri pv. fuscans]SON98462.1 hypothetical protein XFF6960_10002 [Xanthomonas citri pv. fuscans]SOO05189.1 hypothetical protein XFF7767_380002 [Xanthomonas citri pv. fuscans]SOO09062.1 hypothetical protein XFF6970_300156 [Xanthomonas citri pv. fuscans]SOO14483.1 hypothetical protein XFF7766_320002 [Xanthomonas citri pv. fuscans]